MMTATKERRFHIHRMGWITVLYLSFFSWCWITNIPNVHETGSLVYARVLLLIFSPSRLTKELNPNLRNKMGFKSNSTQHNSCVVIHINDNLFLCFYDVFYESLVIRRLQAQRPRPVTAVWASGASERTNTSCREYHRQMVKDNEARSSRSKETMDTTKHVPGSRNMAVRQWFPRDCPSAEIPRGEQIWCQNHLSNFYHLSIFSFTLRAGGGGNTSNLRPVKECSIQSTFFGPVQKRTGKPLVAAFHFTSFLPQPSNHPKLGIDRGNRITPENTQPLED